MTGDGAGADDPDAYLDEAVMEVHHLANLSGLREARQARSRLVAAQSAASRRRTRSQLEEAVEYLELARLRRPDTAAGFAAVRDLVDDATELLRHEKSAPVRKSPAALFDRSGPDRSLEELRREHAVNSFEQVQYDVALDEVFREVRRRVADEREGDGADAAGGPAGAGDVGPEAAVELAALEVDLRRSVQNLRLAGSEFEFVSPESLANSDDRR